jgi:hypothetical protein
MSSSTSGNAAAAYAELRSKHNRLIEVLGVTVTYKDELAEKIASMAAALQAALAERDAARAEHSTSAETLVQKDSRICFLENHANESLRTIHELRQQLAQAASASADNDKAARGTKLKSMRVKIADLRKQLNATRDAARISAKEQRDHVEELSRRVAAAVARERRRSAGSVSSAAAAGDAARQSALERLQAVEAELAAAKEKVAELEAAAGGHRKRARELEFRLTEQTDSFDAKLSFSKMENSELLSQLTAARTQLKDAESSIQALQEQLDALTNKDANKDTANTGSAFKQFLEVKAQNAKLVEQVRRLQAKLKK